MGWSKAEKILEGVVSQRDGRGRGGGGGGGGGEST